VDGAGQDPSPEEIIEREARVRDDEAADYTAIRDEEFYDRSIEEAAALAALDLRADETVLDAGCGTGQHVEMLLGVAGRLIGVDHSARAVEIAAGRVPAADAGRASFHVADLRELPLADGEVDAVLSIEVIQHIPSEELRQDALRELRRVLRPGGRAAVIVYRWLGHIKRGKEGYFPTGIYRYAFSARELRREFEAAGFADVRTAGVVAAPRVAERLGISVDRQRRFTGNPLFTPLSQYLMATAVRPE
jgi:SAM-dependent methyltransferase